MGTSDLHMSGGLTGSASRRNSLSYVRLSHSHAFAEAYILQTLITFIAQMYVSQPPLIRGD